ncbi:E3 ubiquitin-protein ligase [Ceratobasidium theobromae]|uniref:E3 ubiquitin-protein ligase n=1 Tax=Ceratobasidium theobromae TaxID=1582974 RepID=A0A5N5QSR3_9AGAM|nr:E3 ubiquitin-protein ligase [Ceratobasidium theobromae]
MRIVVFAFALAALAWAQEHIPTPTVSSLSHTTPKTWASSQATYTPLLSSYLAPLTRYTTITSGTVIYRVAVTPKSYTTVTSDGRVWTARITSVPQATATGQSASSHDSHNTMTIVLSVIFSFIGAIVLIMAVMFAMRVRAQRRARNRRSWAMRPGGWINDSKDKDSYAFDTVPPESKAKAYDPKSSQCTLVDVGKAQAGSLGRPRGKAADWLDAVAHKSPGHSARLHPPSSTMDQNDDYETLLELTAQFQLMDLEELKAGLKGKGRVNGTLSDIELTYNTLEAEARATLQYIRDRRIAKGAQRATQDNLDLIDTIAEIEAREQADREYALALSNDPDASPSPPATPAPHPAHSYHSPASSSSSISGPSTSRIITPFADSNSVDCVICSDSTTRAYRAPCGCYYDRDCLTELFDKATVDESLFPPRCCNQQISFEQVRSIFSSELVRKFEAKAQEFRTTNRLYCHNPSCSRFLGPAVSTEREKSNRRCTHCFRTTCSFCKNASHASFVPCPTDTAAQQVLALGRQEGWQSCPSCHHMVELDTGCYHMTCRCRHEFCYLCARQWKTCTCVQWDENRLLAQAERRVVRDFGVLPAAARPGQLAALRREIVAMADNLRENHDCNHHIFGFARRGGGNCEVCGYWLRDFLLGVANPSMASDTVAHKILEACSPPLAPRSTMSDDEDETLLELAAQFQLDDLVELRAGLKGKGRVGGRSADIEAAYNAVETEAKITLQRIRDRRIAQSAQRAMRDDANILAVLNKIEEQERADREYAIALHQNANACPPAPRVQQNNFPPSPGWDSDSDYEPQPSSSRVRSASYDSSSDDDLYDEQVDWLKLWCSADEIYNQTQTNDQ